MAVRVPGGHIINIGNVHLKNTLDIQMIVKNEFDKFGCILKIWIGRVCACVTYENADSAAKAIQVIKITLSNKYFVWSFDKILIMSNFYLGYARPNLPGWKN